MHRNIKIAIIANTRDEFENASDISNIIYNDNPSKKSIDYLLSEIRCLGFESFFFGGIEELITACKEKKEYQNTLFFNLSDGLTQPSRKGQAAFLLEILGVPYIGSDPFTRLMTANKSYTKQFLCSQEITSPNGHIIRSLNDFSQYDIEYPIMIKPNNEGSSIGITQESVAFDFTSAVYYLNKLLNKFDEILIEQYIEGYDITNLVIGNSDSFLVSEVIISSLNGKTYFDKEVLGIKEKATGVRKQFLGEEILQKNQIEYIKKMSNKIFKCLNLKDYARFDYRLNNKQLYFLEASPNPVLSETSELGLISLKRQTPARLYLEAIINSAVLRINTK